MLFYGQEYFDTMAILDDKRDLTIENLNQMVKDQKILSNKDLMMRNLSKLLENLQECESYIIKCLEGTAKKDANIARMINNCLSQFTADDMQLLETMVH